MKKQIKQQNNLSDISYMRFKKLVLTDCKIDINKLSKKLSTIRNLQILKL
jgi:hypothetical protein